MRFQRNGVSKADEQRRIAGGLDSHAGSSLLHAGDADPMENQSARPHVAIRGEKKELTFATESARHARATS